MFSTNNPNGKRKMTTQIEAIDSENEDNWSDLIIQIPVEWEYSKMIQNVQKI